MAAASVILQTVLSLPLCNVEDLNFSLYCCQAADYSGQLLPHRTARGAEVDLVLHSSRVRVAIECKFSSTPKPARGFHEAMVDLEADKGFVIAPVREAFDLSAKVRVLPIGDLSAVWKALE